MSEKLTLIETIAKIDMFSSFSRYMGMSGANEAFSAGGDFTVFAPTNDAFGKIPDKKMNALLQEPGQVTLKTLLSNHIVPDRLLAASLGSKGTAVTITGAEVAFTDDRGGLRVNDSGVQARNVEASNGIVHALDTVLDVDVRTIKNSSSNVSPLRKSAAEPPELVVPRLDAGGKRFAAGK